MIGATAAARTPAPALRAVSRQLVTVSLTASLPLLWCAAVLDIWRQMGLFSWIGVDFGVFWAGTRVALSAGPAAAYDIVRITDAIRPLADYYASDALPLRTGIPLYPPVLLALLAPFTLLPAPTGYLAWLVANALLFGYVTDRLAIHLGVAPGRRLVLLAGALGSFPVAYALFMGQPMALWVFALSSAYQRFRRGDDFRAGLWAGVLLFKPQYALVLLAVLVWKRRWRALAGASVVAGAIAASTLVILGVDGVVAFVHSLRSVATFGADNGTVFALSGVEHMISWRGFLVALLPPATPPAAGLGLVAALSVLTLAALPLVWRGPWDPSAPRFAVQVLATMIVTMLTSFHNGSYGAALLLVPGLAVVADARAPRALQALAGAGAVLPTYIFATTGEPTVVAQVLVVLMLAMLIVAVRRQGQYGGPSSQTPAVGGGLAPRSAV